MDHNFLADTLYKSMTKDDDQRASADPEFYTKQSRMHLAYLTIYASELISIGKGIRRRLTIIAVTLMLCVLGIVSLSVH